MCVCLGGQRENVAVIKTGYNEGINEGDGYGEEEWTDLGDVAGEEPIGLLVAKFQHSFPD